MKTSALLGAMCAGVFSLGLVSIADAALISRLGGAAYYDDVLDITWLADANFSQTSGFDTDGLMTLANANAWAASLTVGGFTDWRLPTTNPINGVSFNATITSDGSTDVGHNISRPGTVFGGSTASELAHLFYNTLGNVSDFNVSGVFDDGCAGSCLVNTGPFSNIQPFSYWSSTEFFFPSARYFFAFDNGVQFGDSDYATFFAWAVADGDVSAVPVPAAVWLFGSGLLGLVGMTRRKKA